MVAVGGKPYQHGVFMGVILILGSVIVYDTHSLIPDTHSICGKFNYRSVCSADWRLSNKDLHMSYHYRNLETEPELFYRISWSSCHVLILWVHIRVLRGLLIR